MDPLIYISIPWRDLTHLLEMDVETQSAATKSMPERLQRLMDKQPEQEDDVRLTTADLQWIKDYIPQVGASQFVDFKSSLKIKILQEKLMVLFFI